MTDAQFYLMRFTRDELKAILAALVYVIDFYGSPPDPPTPAMTAQAKVQKALGIL